MTKPEPLHPVQWECSTGTKRKAIYKGESITCERIDSGWIGYYRATTVILHPDLSTSEHGWYSDTWHPQEGWPPRPLLDAQPVRSWLVAALSTALVFATGVIVAGSVLILKRG